jgi:hypothetical protein
MNKILYAFALAGVLGLSSCSDFLDQTSPSEDIGVGINLVQAVHHLFYTTIFCDEAS